MMYDYLCEKCEREYQDPRFERIGNSHIEPCPECGGRLLRGVVNVHLGPVMQEHFNISVNKPISSMRQFNNELKHQSELASEKTGLEHRFVPVDLSDKSALGVTDEGLDATAKVRRDSGLDAPSRRYL